MIPPNVIFWLAMIPFIVLVIGVYWLLFWRLPRVMCEDFFDYNNKWGKWEGPIWSHAIFALIMAVFFSIYWCCEGKDKYEQKYQQYQQQQQ